MSEKRNQAVQHENLHEMTGQDMGIWMYYEKNDMLKKPNQKVLLISASLVKYQKVNWDTKEALLMDRFFLSSLSFICYNCLFLISAWMG